MIFLHWRLRRKQREQDLEDELHAHLAIAERERIERGETLEQAAQNARREFGNEVLIREVTREMWGWASADRIARDVRFALRTLRRSPGFTLTAVVCLSLGIGATTATFSVADSLLLRPLPIRDPSRVVAMTTSTPDQPSAGLSYRDLVYIRQHAASLEGAAGFELSALAFSKSAGDVPRMKMGMYAAGDFSRVLGVDPVLGRAFTAEETSRPGAGAVVVLSYSFWQSEFGGNPGVTGTTVRLNSVPFTVVGVMPENFSVHPTLMPAYYVPFTMTNILSPRRERDVLEARDIRGLSVRARLRQEVGFGQAEQEVASLGRRLAELHPDTHARHTLVVRTELDERIAQAPPLAILCTALVALSILVLVIACANVASLLLARARARGREIAIRLSIGAGRGRLLQQLLTETLVLSLIAATGGVLLALGAIRYLASIPIPTDTPIVLAVRFDMRVLFAALGTAVVTALAAGAAPAWRSLDPNLAPTLKGLAQARGRLIGRHALVVTQIALAVVLLVVSAGLVDAFRRMLIVDPGIRTDGVMMVELDPGLVGYTPDRAREFYRSLVTRTGSLPGVRSVALSRAIPFRPNFTEQSVVPEGYSLPRDQQLVKVSSNIVDDGYFATMDVAVVRGRAFDSSDTAFSGRTAIVNEEFARRYWAGQDAVGKRLRLGDEWLQVVGVARTGKYLSLVEAPQPYIYLPFAQRPTTRMTLLTRTDQDAASLTQAILSAIRAIDPNQPVYNVRNMKAYFQQGVLGMNLTAMEIVWAMGGAGLLLAIVGLYGLVSFSVIRRTREIGIRMAIGADRGAVLRLVLRQGMIVAGTGVALGMVLSVPAFNGLSAALAGLGQLSLWTLAIVPCALLAVAIAATWIPARTASRIDPNVALRLD